MPLAPELHGGLLEALESAYPNPNGFDTFLHRALGRDIESFASRTLARADLYSQVIVGVSASGRVFDFLARLRTEWVDNVKVQAAWRLYSADTGSADGDVFNACLLNQLDPFWNRSKLRMHVRDFLTGRGRRVLVVNGPGRSGRTITRWYIEQAARYHNARPFYLDMKGKTSAGPDYVGRLIALRYQWPLATLPPQHAQASQWAEEIAVWVAGCAAGMTSGERVVLLFDNTCTPGLKTETKELLVNLADQAASEDRLRVTLLAHSEPYTSDARRMAAFEEISPPSKIDVYEFLTTYVAHKGYNVASDALSAVVDRIWDPLAGAGDVLIDDLVEAVKQATGFLDTAATGSPH